MIKGALTGTGAKGLGGELPGQVFYGIQGPAGPEGDDYVLTDTDKAEIAQMAAELVNVPGSGGNVEEHNTDPASHADIRKHLTAANIVEAASGEAIVLDDASDINLVGLKVYGKTIQNGTPTPEIPVPLVNVGNGGSITIKVRTSETDENPQTQTISTPNGLPGIPVSSGGNYTDENGQQWICDEVDFAKGTYTQRILRYTFTGTEPFQRSTYSHWIPLSDLGLSLANIKAALCNWYTFSLASINSAQTPGAFDFYYPAPDFITPKQFRASTYGFDTVSDFKTALRNAYDAGNPMYCLFVLSEPVEMNLTESELPTNVSLHTNYPNTAISNDCGAGMEVEYVADTKLYIDKKFAELSQALLNQ